MKHSRNTQWAIMTALVVWGAISLLFLAGEESPSLSMSATVAIKAGAALSLLLCLLVGRWFNRKGLLPDLDE